MTHITLRIMEKWERGNKLIIYLYFNPSIFLFFIEYKFIFQNIKYKRITVRRMHLFFIYYIILLTHHIELNYFHIHGI